MRHIHYCRVFFYLREGVVSSKKEGGIWGKDNVPSKYKKIINQALMEYCNERSTVFDDNELLVEFATYMLKYIMQC
ncbi:aminoglycoside adenylyltransferase domain-containing protein [Vallitalea okinawensis]|uniref:aminoglycoside adenylyltransferase domain-containing protein n=1 Tax=Vallitalea okinawensis TaxID=2078660 RepID=UPI000CFDD7AB|nr:aminoglycoside adenylyltransferase domain-containing protein [Vallitalea okinawensis]